MVYRSCRRATVATKVRFVGEKATSGDRGSGAAWCVLTPKGRLEVMLPLAHRAFYNKYIDVKHLEVMLPLAHRAFYYMWMLNTSS